MLCELGDKSSLASESIFVHLHEHTKEVCPYGHNALGFCVDLHGFLGKHGSITTVEKPLPLLGTAIIKGGDKTFAIRALLDTEIKWILFESV